MRRKEGKHCYLNPVVLKSRGLGRRYWQVTVAAPLRSSYRGEGWVGRAGCGCGVFLPRQPLPTLSEESWKSKRWQSYYIFAILLKELSQGI